MAKLFWDRAVLVAAATVLGASCALAAEEAPAPAPKDWSVTLDSTFSGKYLWRGIVVVDDPVWQPSATFAWKGLSLNVWGNMDLTDANGERRRFTEADYTLDYTFAVSRRVKLSLGTIRYTFPHTGFPTTQEVYAGVALDLPLAPTLKVYRDVDEANGHYASFAVSHTVANLARFSDKAAMSLALSASVGYGDAKHNRFYYAGSGAGPADLTLSVGLPITIGNHLTIKPGLVYAALLDPEVRRNLRDAGMDPTNLCPGIAFTWSF